MPDFEMDIIGQKPQHLKEKRRKNLFNIFRNGDFEILVTLTKFIEEIQCNLFREDL
jgi:reverse gyrase